MEVVYIVIIGWLGLVVIDLFKDVFVLEIDFIYLLEVNLLSY